MHQRAAIIAILFFSLGLADISFWLATSSKGEAAFYAVCAIIMLIYSVGWTLIAYKEYKQEKNDPD